MKKNRLPLITVLFFCFTIHLSGGKTPDTGKLTKVTTGGKPLAAKKIEQRQKKNKPGATENDPEKNAVIYFNEAVKKQSEKKFKEARKLYTKAVNKAFGNRILRSRAFQNLGVMIHKQGRTMIMKTPEKALKIFEKAEVLYKESMRYNPDRKEVAVNQQLLINDKRLAEKIIKLRKELKEKRRKAREKTGDALNKQKNANRTDNKISKRKKQQEAGKKRQEAQKAMREYMETAKKIKSKQDMNIAGPASKDLRKAEKDQNLNRPEDAEENIKKALDRFPKEKPRKQKQQNKQDQQNNGEKNDSKNKQQQKKDQKTQQKRQQARKQLKKALDKQKQANDERNPQKQKQKQNKANEQTKQAQKDLKDYKKQADKSRNRKQKQNAEKAEKHVDNALGAQQKNNPEKAEKELEKALKAMNKNPENKKDENDKTERNRQKRRKQPEIPPDRQPVKPQSKKYKDKEISPDQAKALLKMMAEQEKTLRDKLKDKQKKAYGIAPVDKDW